MSVARLVLIIALCAITAACGSETEASGAQLDAARKAGISHNVVIDKPSTPYRVVTVGIGNLGTVTGTVEIDSTAVVPADTVHTPSDPRYCGATVTERKAIVSSGKVGDVLVWISNIRAGKDLPSARRFELSTKNCNYEPRVQIITTGGTLNLINEDALVHAVRLFDDATGEMVGTAPFNDNGEVVPFDGILSSPRLIAVSSNVYPWAKAWVGVLDHPYFAVTDKNGGFSISDVPAGQYEMKAYHPVLGMAVDTVNVGPGQQASISFRLSKSGQ